ncbi:MAG: hypothetical protein JWO38_4091 [Gemmataceae bacterium]|nr:hypothetical protein [Gemmataceae bacterium]
MRTVKSLVPSMVLATVAVLGGGPALGAPLPEAKEAVEPVYLPYGITDAAGEVGYLTLPAGDGLVAVDLATGEVLWQTKEANQPLVVAGKRLVARTARDNRVRVVVLDIAAKGKCLLESEPLDLPNWAAVARPWTYQGQNRRFIAEGRIGGANLVALDWWAQAGSWRGTFQSDAELKGKTASGVARVNLETGKVEMLPAVKEDRELRSQWGPEHGLSLDRDTNLKKLPAEVQAVAKRNNWRTAHLAGPRAYGWLPDSTYGLLPTGDRTGERESVQAVDAKTGKVLWERLVREVPKEHNLR